MDNRLLIIEETIRDHYYNHKGVCACGETLYTESHIRVLKLPRDYMVEHLAQAIEEELRNASPE